MELADTTVWARRRQPALKEWFDAGIVNGEICLCEMVAMELLHTASTPAIYTRLRVDLDAMPWLHMDRQDWNRALQIHALLAARGNQLHRSVKPPDIFIAACAERHGVTLVHYDKDFETIGAVTGQPMRWVAPRGTLDQPASPTS